jgi:hypothetical protein
MDLIENLILSFCILKLFIDLNQVVIWNYQSVKIMDSVRWKKAKMAHFRSLKSYQNVLLCKQTLINLVCATKRLRSCEGLDRGFQ